MVEGNLPGESNALMVRVPAIVFFVLTPIFVGIRFWSRIKMRSGLGWDDWTILFSFFCCLTVSVLMMISCEFGFGQHIKNLSKPNRLMTLKLFYVAQIFYKITINLTKASILLLYLRIFVQRYFRILCYILLSIILAYMVATSASSIWQCTPIPRAWDKSIPGTCISLTMNWYANAGFSIATDILIMALPQHVLWKSKLPINQKRALMVVFALGLFVTITSILRMTTLDFSTTSPDTTFDIASTLWTLVEDNVAIICACLPMCRLPLTYIFPSYFASKQGSSAGSYNIKSAPRTNSSAFIHAGTSRNDWHPYQGREEKTGIHLTSVQAKPKAGDDTSEEYILPAATTTDARHVRTPSEEAEDRRAIRKTMAFHMTYDENAAKV
ncbi:integral membrane protein [Colletotrichum higginsianum]|uniref:Integral membrane protein n=1 Tax=Colletotrichum higginsianum (strain IMI 349063) TaxID=759273 RepID=H1V016_COLHI|nr:Integral membrane protein [Colletotrichum higginsianum IMI 349063]OBR04252.1 Integral membrane protein [Colletotrichum higginsianum IMI 349063]CCF33567.1 integral membrane protein [Colletotrichum higginsianum]